MGSTAGKEAQNIITSHENYYITMQSRLDKSLAATANFLIFVVNVTFAPAVMKVALHQIFYASQIGRSYEIMGC